jgi:hypothetical protein
MKQMATGIYQFTGRRELILVLAKTICREEQERDSER